MCSSCNVINQILFIIHQKFILDIKKGAVVSGERREGREGEEGEGGRRGRREEAFL